ncbi:hypothetical protein [Clostridium akagii]|uniref:hypothetical protein n=1 Tax=Clostridium akagii TaxID=91623 RepID=UPI00047EBEE7|nr:hypothetical protein [Clostridium akagii]
MDSDMNITPIFGVVVAICYFCVNISIVMDIKDNKCEVYDDLVGSIEENGFQVWHLFVCILFAGVIIGLILIYLINHLCKLIIYVIVFLFNHILKPIFTLKIVSENYLKKWFK